MAHELFEWQKMANHVPRHSAHHLLWHIWNGVSFPFRAMQVAVLTAIL